MPRYSAPRPFGLAVARRAPGRGDVGGDGVEQAAGGQRVVRSLGGLQGRARQREPGFGVAQGQLRWGERRRAASSSDIQRQSPVAIDTKIRPMTSSLVEMNAACGYPFERENCTHNPEVAGSNPAPATR
jgi:hypothetical protein